MKPKSDTTKQPLEEKNYVDSKEGLHTQWEVEYCLDQSIFIMEGDKPIAMIQSEEDEGITPEMKANAELIVKAVNERKALLDSNRELLMNVLTGIDIIKNLLNGEDGKLSKQTREMYENFCINVKKTAINNAKNISD